MNKFKIIVIVVLIAVVVVVLSGLYMYNKPHRDIAGEKANFNLEAVLFIDEFNADENASNTKYLDKVILVTGQVVSISETQSGLTIYLEDEFDGISANFDSLYVSKNQAILKNLATGSDVSVKGKCDGKLLLQGIILNGCIIETE